LLSEEEEKAFEAINLFLANIFRVVFFFVFLFKLFVLSSSFENSSMLRWSSFGGGSSGGRGLFFSGLFFLLFLSLLDACTNLAVLFKRCRDGFLDGDSCCGSTTLEEEKSH
jgi:hypothetical protein